LAPTLAGAQAPPELKDTSGAWSQLIDFLEEKGSPTHADGVRREHLEAFIEDQLDSRESSTARTRYRDLHVLFKWLDDEEEIAVFPMRRMGPPKVEESQVPIIPLDDLQALLKACQGSAFESRRDTALILLLDTGARLSEVADMRVVDIDWNLDVVLVVGKGRRHRSPLSRRYSGGLAKNLTSGNGDTPDQQALYDGASSCPSSPVYM